MNSFEQVTFQNANRPNFQFDLIKLEELLAREDDHDATKVHQIQFYKIFLVTEGKGKHAIDLTNYEYQGRSLLTTRKGQLNKFFDSQAKGYLLLFTEDFLATQLSKVEVSRSILLFNELLNHPKVDLKIEDYHDLLQIVQIIEKEYAQYDDQYSTSVIRSALHMFISKLFRIKTNVPDVFLDRKYFEEFVQLQKLVEEQCLQTRKVQDYADQMGCTTKTLNKIARSVLGKSAKELIDESVIIQIKRMLINTTDSIKEIAYGAGFDEPSNLYKYFKKLAGSTPEVFRQTHI